MQEEMFCAGDIFAEMESAELLGEENNEDIKTLWAECGVVTFRIC